MQMSNESSDNFVKIANPWSTTFEVNMLTITTSIQLHCLYNVNALIYIREEFFFYYLFIFAWLFYYFTFTVNVISVLIVWHRICSILLWFVLLSISVFHLHQLFLKRVSKCCSTASEQFFSYIFNICQWNDHISFVQDQHA